MKLGKNAHVLNSCHHKVEPKDYEIMDKKHNRDKEEFWRSIGEL